MALVSVIFGGMIGFVGAAIALACGLTALTALAVWSVSGLVIAALLMAIGLFPRPAEQADLATENA